MWVERARVLAGVHGDGRVGHHGVRPERGVLGLASTVDWARVDLRGRIAAAASRIDPVAGPGAIARQGCDMLVFSQSRP